MNDVSNVLRKRSPISNRRKSRLSTSKIHLNINPKMRAGHSRFEINFY